MKNPDPYFKKTIKYPYRGNVLDFRVSQELFSSQAVDTGTQRLMRSVLDPRFDSLIRVLDLGCGYGPIGLTLSKITSKRMVHLVDRDALAVAYSLENAGLAHLPNVRIYGSLGYSDVTETDFDLIISNIPAKAGEPVITNFLYGAVNFLSRTGLVAIVVVTPLDSFVTGVLARSDIEVVQKKAWPGHTVFQYRFLNDQFRDKRQGSDQEYLEAYGRNKMTVKLPGIDYTIRTVFGIPEFDSLNYRTELALAVMKGLKMSSISRAAAHNAGQGHVAVGLWRIFSPDRLDLIDRDLLSLRITKLNLVSNGCSDKQVTIRHQVGMNLGEVNDLDLAVIGLDDDEDVGVHSSLVTETVKHLSNHGAIVVASRVVSTARLESVLRAANTVRIVDRQRKNGYEALALRRNGE